MVQFSNQCIDYSKQHAIACLIHQSLLQEHVRDKMESSLQLSVDAQTLFLHIAKLLFSMGQINHDSLSWILQLLLAPLQAFNHMS